MNKNKIRIQSTRPLNSKPLSHKRQVEIQKAWDEYFIRIAPEELG